MMCIQKCEMHLFKIAGQALPIVYQIDTGLFYELDTLHEAILACCEGVSSEQVVQALVGSFELEEIIEAIQELAYVGLISDGALSIAPQGPMTESVADGHASQTDRLQVSLHISHACNMSCIYCFAQGGHYGHKAMLMQPEIAKQAVRWIIAQARDLGRCQIDFFGGEPLLNFPLLCKIVPFAKTYAAQMGVKVVFGIVTNGTLLTEEIQRFLIDEHFQIKISVDGGRETQDRMRTFHNGSGTYDTVARNVKALTSEAPERVYLQAIMTAYDMDQDGIAEQLRSLGTQNTLVGPVVASPDKPYAIREAHLLALKAQIHRQSRQAAKAILNKEKDEAFDACIEKLLTRKRACRGCLGGKQYLAISVDGSIFPCSSLSDVPEFKMGDVLSGIDSARQNQIDALFRVQNRPECKNCWARHLCGGGCLWDALATTGDSTCPNPVSCEQTRYRYELAMALILEIQSVSPELLPRRYQLEISAAP